MQRHLRIAAVCGAALSASACSTTNAPSADEFSPTDATQDEETSAVEHFSDALVEAEPAAISTACAPDAIGDPPEFVWTYHSNGDYYSGELEVSEATFTIGGETLTTRAYRQPGQPHFDSRTDDSDAARKQVRAALSEPSPL